MPLVHRAKGWVSKLTLGGVELRKALDAPSPERLQAATDAIPDDVRTEVAAALASEGFQGQLLFPGDEQYDAVRSRPFYFNHAAKYPSAIALAATVADVRAVVAVLAGPLRSKLPKLAVAAGAHTGNAMVEGTFVLGVHKMASVEVDVAAGTVRVAAGAKISAVDEALAPKGLGFVTGTNGDTGVAGLTLAGGAGYLSRKHGFACDNVLEMEVVTAEAAVVVATDDNEHKDLLKALRGGGGNFGVVTSFLFRTFPTEHVMAGLSVRLCPTKAALKKVMTKWAAVIEQQDPVWDPSAFSFFVLPAGAPVAVTQAVYVGDAAKDAKKQADIPALAELKDIGGWAEVKNDVRPMTYLKLQQMLSAVQQPCFGVTMGLAIETLDEATIDGLVRFARSDYPCKTVSILIMSMGGEMSRGDRSRTSMSHRKAHYWCIIDGAHRKYDDAGMYERIAAWEQRIKAHVIAHGGRETSHPFVLANADNKDGDEIFEDDVKAFLQRAKALYDPTNLFSFNKNISVAPPADAPVTTTDSAVPAAGDAVASDVTAVGDAAATAVGAAAATAVGAAAATASDGAADTAAAAAATAPAADAAAAAKPAVATTDAATAAVPKDTDTADAAIPDSAAAPSAVTKA